jgi:hypothetical protein
MSLEKLPQQRIDEAVALLKRIEGEFAPAAFANSLGAEDMVLTDLIARHAPGIEMFTLDTGRLHEETYRLMQQVADQYDQPPARVFPAARGGAAVRDGAWRERLLRQRRVAQGLLPRAQGRAARPGAEGQGGLDHRPAPRAGCDPTRPARARVRRRPRHREVQPARRLERGRGVGLHPCLRRTVQRTARARLSQHRLRAMHPRAGRRRGPPRRQLVVGGSRHQGMRVASGQARARRRPEDTTWTHT